MPKALSQQEKDELGERARKHAETEAARAARHAARERERGWVPDTQLEDLDDDGLAREATYRGVDLPATTPRRKLIAACKAARTQEQ